MNLWIVNRRVQLVFWLEDWWRLIPRYAKWTGDIAATLDYSLNFGPFEIRVWHTKEMSNYLWDKLRHEADQESGTR